MENSSPTAKRSSTTPIVRKPLDDAGLGDQSGAVGADEDAGDQEPHERRELDPVKEIRDRERDGEQDNKLPENSDSLVVHGPMIT